MPYTVGSTNMVAYDVLLYIYMCVDILCRPHLGKIWGLARKYFYTENLVNIVCWITSRVLNAQGRPLGNFEHDDC